MRKIRNPKARDRVLGEFNRSTLDDRGPEIPNRGAFMSGNSSVHQIAGAAACAGMIAKQNDKFSPLEHYNILGYTLNDLRGIHFN